MTKYTGYINDDIERDLQQCRHDVACMAAKAAADQLTSESPDVAASAVLDAYLKAMGRLKQFVIVDYPESV